MTISQRDINDLGLEGCTTRPLALSDTSAVFELMAADELESIGMVAIEEADLVSDWQRPSFDLVTQSIGVFDGADLVGYAEVSSGRRATAVVAGDHRGRGVGTALARWTERVSRRDGSGLVGQPVPAGSHGERLLRDLGYEVLWTSWVLEMPQGRTIEPQPIPEGYAIRAAEGDADYRAAHLVVEDAFLEWADREREPYSDFTAQVVERPGFEPWHLRLMTDPSGAVVGTSILQLTGDTGFVSRLAVRRDQRHRGLARALLVDSFERAREHGATRSELSTDSRTGALSLYEKVGMQVTSTWRHWAIDTSRQP
ncbi:GNAT family N-acetyltransferase [Intrasporangium calvum]|uniref:GNAT family N-acetyltransferase n=1 Tax=Intrasporangium calvum TaxID=53358 RepID=A0ABT5GGG4_9MICO|nr:GNAT family N-acetyltransferase [Intrasporangium calvum]MDC5697016.1 GNAT family N-acetyltransferase [Intrasporangium calvum]